MKTSDSSCSIPLASASEIALDLCLLRDECAAAALCLTEQVPLDEAALEDCACLDDALDKAHTALQAALKKIQYSRIARNL